MKSKTNIRVRILWWLVGAQSQMHTALSSYGNDPVQTVNQCQLQDPAKTQNDEGLANPQYSHDGSLVSSFNPKTRLAKSHPNSHDYVTCSKGRPTMLSLSTTSVVGTSGLRPAQAQRVTFCSRCTCKSFLNLEQYKKCWYRSGSFLFNITVASI